MILSIILQLISYFILPITVAQYHRRLDIHNDNSNRTILHHAESRRALNAEQEISQLQTWLDDQVSTKNTMVGVSAFIVAGSKPIHTVTSGKAVLAKAWDATNKKGVQSSPKDVTPNTVSMWASTSKLITWTSLSMLLDAGKFGLDDPVDEVLPFKVRNPNFPNIPVTYRHLYAHTSGLIDIWSGYLYDNQCPSNPMTPYSSSISLESSVKNLVTKNSKWKSWKPGSKHLYSNYGTALAALLVEKHSGISFPEFTKTYIFDPLEMSSTKYSRPSDGSAAELYTLYQRNGYKYKSNYGGYCFPDYPSGQLWSTPTDLAKFAIAMLNRGNLGRTTSNGADCLYSEETGKLVFLKSSPTTGDGDSALGWFVGPPYYSGGAGHDGSETGVSADFLIHLSNNIAIGYWANGELTDAQYKSMYDRLLKSATAIGSIDMTYNANISKLCTTTFSTAPPTTSATLQITVKTDQHGSKDNSWKLFKRNNLGKFVVVRKRNSFKNSQLHTNKYNFPNSSCFIFRMYDSFGDGLLGNAYFTVKWKGNKVIYSKMSGKKMQGKKFGACL